MVAPEVQGIDLFKIANRSISGWIPSLKTGTTLRQPFCSQREECTLIKRRSYNLVFLHARRKTFPAFADIAVALQEVWPWEEVASVEEVASRLSHQFPVDLVEAAMWKIRKEGSRDGTSRSKRRE